MSVSIMDVALQHAYGVEMGASPLVTILCNADIRTEFAKTGTPPYRHTLEYTLADAEHESELASSALDYMRMWGLPTPPELVD